MSRPTYQLRLYVAGMTPKNLHILSVAHEICDQLAPDECAIEAIDVLVSPERAREDKVSATPTLVKVRPPPVVWIVGDLSDVQNVANLLRTVEGAPRGGKLRVVSAGTLPRT